MHGRIQVFVAIFILLFFSVRGIWSYSLFIMVGVPERQNGLTLYTVKYWVKIVRKKVRSQYHSHKFKNSWHTHRKIHSLQAFCMLTPLHWFSVVGEGEGKLGIKGMNICKIEKALQKLIVTMCHGVKEIWLTLVFSPEIPLPGVRERLWGIWDLSLVSIFSFRCVTRFASATMSLGGNWN